MAAVPVTIVGIESRSDGTSENVTIVGMASLTGLGVGGGPIQPPAGGGEPPGIWPGPGPLPHPEHPIAPGGPPPGIWPSPGHPAHPIAPGGPPPGIWPGPGPLPHPEHPIVLPPDEGTKPPDPIQPPVDWKAIWTPTDGWVVVGIPNVPHPAPSS